MAGVRDALPVIRAGAATGGVIASVYSGSKVILTVGIICGATTLVTFFYSDRKTILG